MEARFSASGAEVGPKYSIPNVIDLSDLLQCLVECSQKAAKIAQIFRDIQNDIFPLLIQEKAEYESNKRFVQDFKTLADVLVQETIKKDVGEKFPTLVPHIQGEEQNSFKNNRGETIDIVLTDNTQATIHMLSKVLPGKTEAAEKIAKIVHSTDILCSTQCSAYKTYPINKLGIWIDPIDSTAEYIEGKYDEKAPDGLKCVCVLIGVYDLETYSPIMGVVNQPFHSATAPSESRWESKFYWSINLGTNSIVSPSIQTKDIEESDGHENFGIQTKDCEKMIVLTSTSENPQLQDLIKRKYKLAHISGAGHKALLVAIQKADLYILSKSTTYFWDTCGPHAILNAVGGGIIKLSSSVNDRDLIDTEFLQKKQVKYEPLASVKGTKAFQNVEGIIAYRDFKSAISFLSYLRESGYVAR